MACDNRSCTTSKLDHSKEIILRLFSGTQWDTQPTCDRCDLAIEKCECPPLEPQKGPVAPPEQQKVRIRKEKRRKGKVVTTISGLQFAAKEDRVDFLKNLKNECGAGGTIEDEVLEIQGDHVERLERSLRQQGYSVKVAGR